MCGVNSNDSRRTVTELLVILIVAAAAAAVAYPALRHRPSTPDAPKGSKETAPARPPTEAGSLVEKKARVLSALREIEADRDDGKVTEADYERLKREYEAEAAAVLRQLDALGPAATAAYAGTGTSAAEPATRRRGFTPGLAWGFAIVVFGALVGALLVQGIRPRGPDGSITGNEIADGSGDTGGGGMGRGGMGGGGALVPVDLSKVPELERRIAADSTDVDALNELSHLYVSTQDFGRAADLTMRALRIDPKNAQAMTHLGVVLWANGNLDDALQAFNHAIQFDPKWHESYLFKGIVLFAGKQDYPGAVEAWEAYLEVAPPEANTDRVRGMLEGARRAATMGGAAPPGT